MALTDIDIIDELHRAADLAENAGDPGDGNLELRAIAEIKKLREVVDEMALMLDVINSCIVTGIMPAVKSPCNAKLLELIIKAGKKPTAVV